jgi:hypothetical protein
MHGQRAISLIIALTLAILPGSVADAAQKRKKTFAPGKARWEIKTSVPADIDLKNSKKVNLPTLLVIKWPPGAKGHSHRMDHRRYAAAPNARGLVEGQIISTTGWIHLIAAEPDGDYHIQIAPTNTNQSRCFIVEVPRPLQKFIKDKRVRNAAAMVRAKIRSKVLNGKELKYGGTRLLKSPVFARMTGQFFYDDWHIGDRPRGKKGCKSPTITEIHPITAVAFPTPP